MSTSIKNLRQLAARDVKDHTAIFDSWQRYRLSGDQIRTGSGEYRQSAGRLRGADSKTEAPGGRRGRSSMRG